MKALTLTQNRTTWLSKIKVFNILKNVDGCAVYTINWTIEKLEWTKLQLWALLYTPYHVENKIKISEEKYWKLVIFIFAKSMTFRSVVLMESVLEYEISNKGKTYYLFQTIDLLVLLFEKQLHIDWPFSFAAFYALFNVLTKHTSREQETTT